MHGLPFAMSKPCSCCGLFCWWAWGKRTSLFRPQLVFFVGSSQEDLQFYRLLMVVACKKRNIETFMFAEFHPLVHSNETMLFPTHNLCYVPNEPKLPWRFRDSSWKLHLCFFFTQKKWFQDLIIHVFWANVVWMKGLPLGWKVAPKKKWSGHSSAWPQREDGWLRMQDAQNKVCWSIANADVTI